MDSIPLTDELSPYGYRPTLWICVVYIALFSATLGIHFQQMVSSRYWFLGPTVLFGASLEILGWAGRLWSSQDLFNSSPFLMQISCLILGPTPLLAANFIIFMKTIQLLGQEYSRLRPRLYTYIFLSCDMISLITQGAAGGIISVSHIGESINIFGKRLMIVGIGFQVFMLTFFIILGGEYTFRCIKDRPLRRYRTRNRLQLDTPRKILLSAMGITTFLLYIRSIYRLIELSNGFESKLAQTQWLFNLFDAALVAITFFTWNVAHPSFLLEHRSAKNDHEDDLRMKQSATIE